MVSNQMDILSIKINQISIKKSKMLIKRLKIPTLKLIKLNEKIKIGKFNQNSPYNLTLSIYIDHFQSLID